MAAFGTLATALLLGLLAWALIRNPQWGHGDARVLALGVIIPFAAVMVFVGVLLL